MAAASFNGLVLCRTAWYLGVDVHREPDPAGPRDRHGNAGVDVERGGRERSIETPRQLLGVDKSPPVDGAVGGRTLIYFE